MASNGRYYISTTIPYVNGAPHIGHALEFVQTDAFGRFHRLIGDETYVLTGTDENALKNVRAAEDEGIPIEQLVNRNSSRFQVLADRLGLEYDQFIRTSVDPQHAKAAVKLWSAADANGDIYRKRYSGLYCVGCEEFYAEDELTPEGLCPEHGTRPELVDEENYFFRLSRYQDRLHELISSDSLRIIPEFRKRETLNFIAQGLHDFSISRSQERARGWGIRVPGDPSQVMYVWFDALINYISALGYADEGPLFQTFWLDNPQRIHALGKGVSRFHTVYWPAMLLSAKVPLPHLEFVHGYINIGGVKMSKSLGNVIDPESLVDEYGAEATRYFLLRGVSPVRDADFGNVGHFHDQLRSRYNSDLANDLGNLVNRTASMIVRYRGGVVPGAANEEELEKSVRNVAVSLPDRVATAMRDYDPQTALESVWELVARCNRYVEESKPWELARAEREGDERARDKLSTALSTLAASVRLIGALLEPFLPFSAIAIQEQIGQPPEGLWQDRISWRYLSSSASVDTPHPLFPRLELAPSASSG